MYFLVLFLILRLISFHEEKYQNDNLFLVLTFVLGWGKFVDVNRMTIMVENLAQDRRIISSSRNDEIKAIAIREVRE